jgi:hypothetical protein
VDHLVIDADGHVMDPPRLFDSRLSSHVCGRS